MRDTLESAEIGTWEWDIEEDRVHWSANIERIFGLEPGTFGGTYEAWLALVHPDDRPAVVEQVTRAVREGGRYRTEFRFLRPDGSVGWQSGRGHIVKGPEGRARLLRGIVVDATEQVRARRQADELAEALRLSEARYRSFVAQSTEGIWRCELDRPLSTALPVAEQIEAAYRDGYLAECNDAMARMYGYESAESLAGVRLAELLVREDPKNTEYLRAFVESGYRLENAESHEVARDGTRRVFQNSLVGIVEDGHLVRAWGTQRDVTAQTEARERADAASAAKDHFLAMLGHELRNPLAPIVSALELMKVRGSSEFDRERAVIERQVRHMVRLVDDLLDVSRITRGDVRLENEHVDLADTVAVALELATPLLQQREHRVHVHAPRGAVVRGDSVRLGQILANLLVNAAKYTPPGGDVTVTLEQQSGWAKLRVRDNGVGIRAELLPRIFELFVQERQGLDRSTGGLGLGLAIVRALTAAHGGTIEAHSDGPGRGSEFTVSLPTLS